ncbi:MAG TPA: matrixin family metalloprotease [Candidatus Nitrosotenuis sp.]|nr:matrixin family metalloprotease [Candidatus Nitrosotenuis sp.]
MRPARGKFGSVLRGAAALALSALLALPLPLLGGGPLAVGGPTSSIDGQPFVWDASQPVPYRVDGGPLALSPSGVTVIDNAAAVTQVQAMFQVWENVPTANIRFTNAGAVQSAGSFADGDVSTALEFLDVEASCDAGAQSPIIFDANGAIIAQLIGDPAVIGFASPCSLDGTTGRIRTAEALLNGRFRDGVNQGTNFELTADEFEEIFVHEFGHFLGLDHSQINENVLNGTPNACSVDSLAGLPLMFPVTFCQARKTAGLTLLAPDDEAWISWLYPESTNSPPGQVPFASGYGAIQGVIFFSDGLTHAQGVNVIARRVDDGNPANGIESVRIAFSAVSGFRFTGNPGQNVTGNNPGSLRGSRNPALLGFYEIPVTPGAYTVEVGPILHGFSAGSSVGPLSTPIPSPGPNEFWDATESATDDPAATTTITVAAGQTVSNIDIILNSTPPRFDAFESAALELPEMPPAILSRKKSLAAGCEEAV